MFSTDLLLWLLVVAIVTTAWSLASALDDDEEPIEAGVPLRRQEADLR